MIQVWLCHGGSWQPPDNLDDVDYTWIGAHLGMAGARRSDSLEGVVEGMRLFSRSGINLSALSSSFDTCRPIVNRDTPRPAMEGL
jgi:hypothetical protein